MPPRTPRPAYPRHIVTAVLVAHDGARWLPASLAGLGAQTRAPQRVVAVDTGSSDDSERLLAAALGESAVLSRPAGTGFGAAVQAGLDAFAGAPSVPASSADPLEWVWLLHDDCVPEPTALEALLGYVDEAPSAGVVGPKCRTWDGRYLLELGITTDITGRRETGLARRELDQGQHDRVLDVLAVGSAGALIRRDVWDALGGYDPALPLFRDDLDFGWRANLAGWRVAVVPAAVLRHVRALERGVRTGPAARRTRRQDREHAIYVLLANAPPARLPLLLVRLALAAVLRPLGLLLARRPRRAVDEVAAYARVAVRPVALLRARRHRAGARRVPYRDLRPLFPRFGARVRHYGEALTDLVTAERFGAAAMLPAVPVSEPGRTARTAGTPPGAGRRGRRRVIETGPVADEAVDLEFGGPGLLRWLLVRPGVLLALGLVLLALVADRGVLSGALHGGVLLPAPGGAADWWSSYLSSWHPVGTGSATGAPPYLAVLAGLATVLLGKAWLAVDVLVLGAVPLAGLSAYSAAGALTRRLPLRVWAALSYAVLPVLTGAVATGRLDGIVAAVALPWLLRCGARAVLGPGRGWRRAFSAGLWLALAGAFAPVLELLAALVVLGAVLARWSVPGRRRRLAAGGIVLAVPPALLFPWTAALVAHPSRVLAGPGLAGPGLDTARLPAHDLLLGWPGGPGLSPAWVLVPLALAALVGVVRVHRGGLAAAGWGLVLAGLSVGIVSTHVRLAVPGGLPAQPAWPGAATAVVGAGLILATLVAADDARAALGRRSFGWRQPVAVMLAVTTGVVPVVAGMWWVIRGAGGPLTARPPSLVPSFVAAGLVGPDQPRLLVLRAGGGGGPVRFTLLRRPQPPVLGDADVAPPSGGSTRLAGVVRTLTAGTGGSTAAAELWSYGVADIVLLPPVDRALAGVLDRTTGLVRNPSTSVAFWQLVPRGRQAVLLAPAAAAVALGGAVPTGSALAGTVGIPAGPLGITGTLPAGPDGRVLVLAETADVGWRASVAGVRLPAARAYGWAQAFTVPADGGVLSVRHVDPRRSAAVLGELAALVLVLILAAPGSYRRGSADGDGAPEEADLDPPDPPALGRRPTAAAPGPVRATRAGRSGRAAPPVSGGADGDAAVTGVPR